jgi:putative redox protein
MVEMRIRYTGSLRCEATHGPSGATIQTDAPKDNMGKGEAFSPTDLVATAVGTCMLTIMGIMAARHGIDIAGTEVRVSKEMVSSPTRRIGTVTIDIHVPMPVSDEDKLRLQGAAETCPVVKSLHPEVRVPVHFHWS